MKIRTSEFDIMFRDVCATNVVAVEKKLEIITRNCYKSEDKITDDSYCKLLNGIRRRGHLAMFEHQSVCFRVNTEYMNGLMLALTIGSTEVRDRFGFLRITRNHELIDIYGIGPQDCNYVSGTITAFQKLWNAIRECDCFPEPRESGGPGLMYPYCHVEHLCSTVRSMFPLLMEAPDGTVHSGLDISGKLGDVLTIEEIAALPYKVRRHHQYETVRMVTNRAISHELVRHRRMGVAQESTRYVGYGVDDNDIEFIYPLWMSDRMKVILKNRDITMSIAAIGNDEDSERKLQQIIDTFVHEKDELRWFLNCLDCEDAYRQLREVNWAKGRARNVLSHDLKTEIYVTANLAQWEWIFAMRVPLAAHEQFREITIPLQEEMRELIPEMPYVEPVPPADNEEVLE
jgi:thymidylate synthase (FAD)